MVRGAAPAPPGLESTVRATETDGRAADGAAAEHARTRFRGPRAPRLRARAGAPWDERCEALFTDLRKPAAVMIRRAFGAAFSEHEIEDVYANAWTSTLAALRGRAEGMDDEALRSYLLTAVANHAAKEMRRRARRPTSELSDRHAQVLHDPHLPAPEERVVSSEAGAIARDVLSSLPSRRRAVILLRYGWGLEPKEVCSLVDGLSPRAYRKEITRGVEQMIERLRETESGEWCRSREPLLRDYVAGVADRDARRQAVKHIDHCRRCGELVGRLSGGLNELGSAGWVLAAGAIGEAPSGGIAGILERGREATLETARTGGEAATAVASTGGTRGGAGAIGAGALAKMTGLGALGKAALACAGAGAGAVACVVGGVVSVDGPGRDGKPPAQPAPKTRSLERVALKPTLSVDQFETPANPEQAGPRVKQDAPRPADEAPEPEAAVPTAPEGAPVSSPAPTAPAGQQEFGLPAAATPGSGSPAGSGSGGGGSRAGGGDVAREFGP